MYNTIESLSLSLGRGADTVQVNALAPMLAATLDTGAGADTVSVAGGSVPADSSVTSHSGAAGGGCSLDADGNNTLDALSDGLLLLRAMLGLTGDAVTNGAVGLNATRGDWTAIRNFLNGNCGTSFQP